MAKFILVAVVFLVSGCTSNAYLYESANKKPTTVEKITVYVTNPNIGQPYDVLIASGIYNITGDSGYDNKLTLRETIRGAVCGNPLISSFLTLGTIPVSLPSFDEFSYTIETPVSTIRYHHQVDTYIRISIWEWLFKPFVPSEVDILSEGLATSERTTESPRAFNEVINSN